MSTGKSKKRVSKVQEASSSQNGRERVDSILGNKMDEFYGFKRM